MKHKKSKNIWRIIRHCWEQDRAIVLVMLFRALTTSVISLVGVYLTKLIIDEITGQNRLEVLAFIVVSAALVILLCNIVGSNASAKVWYRIVMLRLKLVLQRGRKLMGMDYQMTENPDVMDKLARSNKAASDRISKSGCAVSEIMGSLFHFVPNLLLTVAGYILILLQVSPLLICFVAFTVVLQYYCSQRINKIYLELEKQYAALERRREYYEEQMEDAVFSKEIRIYRLSRLLMKKYDRLWSEIARQFIGGEKRVVPIRVFDVFINLIRYGAVSAFLYWQVTERGMSVGDFSLYLTTVIAFSNTMVSMIQKITDLDRFSVLLEDFYVFLDIPENSGGGALPAGEPQPIVLDRVTFTYPGSEKPVLRELSLTVHPGEKLALVGINGCGKTTLVKLLTGLYHPSSGGVRYGDRDVKDFDSGAWFGLFSTVFQDVNIFAMTVAENVALCEAAEIDCGRVREALELAGLWEDVEKLKDTYDHQLQRIFSEEGTVLSGGQAQKLALARALYQDHSIVILDEPTASLDPLAEYNIYCRFNEIVGKKTAVYISHRLSSTRFCDRIAYMEDGRITELGTHEELMERNGSYAEMFRKQAHYYQGGDGNEL